MFSLADRTLSLFLFNVHGSCSEVELSFPTKEASVWSRWEPHATVTRTLTSLSVAKTVAVHLPQSTRLANALNKLGRCVPGR